MIENYPPVHSVKFRENPYGGWYAIFLNKDGKKLGDRYYGFMPRWWFRAVAKKAFRKTLIFDGASVTRDDLPA
jgi:hypothetical protein